MEKKRKPTEIEITELFLIKADWHRTFMGEIYREKSEDVKDIIRGNVVVNEGKIWSIAETQEELGKYLDDICTMKLDYNLHASTGESVVIAGTSFSLN